MAVTAASGARLDGNGDRIRPVYPLEALLGIFSAGRARAILGAAGWALLRQLVPDRPTEAPDQQTDVPLLPGKQDKHIRGTNNFIEGRSELTADPQALLRKFAGRGSMRGNIPVGEPGSKEAFDTGDRIIGIFRDRIGRSDPTTRGIIAYAKDGAHVYPARPNGWIP
jgi:hypothetical protein